MKLFSNKISKNSEQNLALPPEVEIMTSFLTYIPAPCLPTSVATYLPI